MNSLEVEEPDSATLAGDQETAEKEAEDLAKKAEQDLSQEVYSTLMKEMAQDSNSNTVSHENLSILLFMTQKAISDLKLLKSLFYHRKFTGGFGYN